MSTVQSAQYPCVQPGPQRQSFAPCDFRQADDVTTTYTWTGGPAKTINIADAMWITLPWAQGTWQPWGLGTRRVFVYSALNPLDGTVKLWSRSQSGWLWRKRDEIRSLPDCCVQDGQAYVMHDDLVGIVRIRRMGDTLLVSFPVISNS